MPLAVSENRTLLRAVAVAVLVAVVVATIFQMAVTERLIERAIALDDQAQQQRLAERGSMAARPEPVFSRRTQRLGLPPGVLLYGVAMGAIVAGVYGLLAPRTPGADARALAWLVGSGAVLVAVVVPFLKFPANPPGVGDPATLARRQLLYLGLVLLSIAGLWLAVRLHRRLRHVGARRAATLAALFYLAWTGVLLLALPGRTDPINVPFGLLWQFRAASVVGQLLFWATFLAVFASSVGRAPDSGQPNLHVPR